MTLNQYIKELQELVLQNPEHGDLEVVYSRDDEGNGFNKVHFGPSKGKFDEDDKDFDQEGEPNAVCVN